VFSPDGALLAALSSSTTIRVWDTRSGRSLGSPIRANAPYKAFAFAPDANRLLTVSDTVGVWNPRTGEAISRPSPSGHISAYDNIIAISGDGSDVAMEDTTGGVWIWNTRTSASRTIPSQSVAKLTLNNDGSRVAILSRDWVANVYDVQTGARVGVTLRPMPGESFDEVIFSPDGKRIGTHDGNDVEELWNANTGQRLGAETDAGSIAFSADSRELIGVFFRPFDSMRWGISTIDSETGAAHQEVRADSNAPVYETHFGGLTQEYAPLVARQAVLGSDGKVRLINTSHNRPSPFATIGRPIRAIRFSSDGRHLLVADASGLSVWNAADGAAVSAPISYNRTTPNIDALSPDGTLFAAGGWNGRVRLWDVHSGSERADIQGSRPLSLSFSSDSHYLASWSAEGHTRVLDTRSGKVLAVSPPQMTVSEGTEVLAVEPNGTVRSFDSLARLPGELPLIGGSLVAISHDGSLLAAISSSSTEMRNVNTGTTVWRNSNRGDGVVFSSDMRFLATYGARSITVLDAATGSPIVPTFSTKGIVSAVAFSPDSNRLAIAEDQDVEIWTVPAVYRMSRSELISFACGRLLANGLSFFSADELRNTPMLDRRLDVDACRPPSIWQRLATAFSAEFQR
jgi:WD40 repeat protein